MKNLPKNKIKLRTAYFASTALLILAALAGTLLGASHISFTDIIRAIFTTSDSTEAKILLYVRFPRVLASILCGASLAVSGAVIQAVLANKLASPSIIGVNSGAGLAVTLCAAFGILGGWTMSAFAFLGAFISVFIVSMAAKKLGASRGTVILMGVALNSLISALTDTVRTLVPDVSIISNDFRIGDFSAVTFTKLIPGAVMIISPMAVVFSLSNELDVLTLGDENAKGLGQNTSFMRALFLLLSALLAGTAVSIAGLLSFVGLIVPHMVRRISTSQARHLLPLCALFGAGFVTLCDTASRVIFAPYELPVGIIMAVIGAPLFIFILIKRKGERTNDRA